MDIPLGLVIPTLVIHTPVIQALASHRLITLAYP